MSNSSFDNSNSDKIKILEQSDATPPKSRKRRVFRLFCILSLILVVLIVSGVVYLKLKYNDEYIKERLITAFNDESQATIQIERLTTSWLEQKISLGGVKIIPNNNPDYPILTISEFTFDLDLIKSYEDNSVYSNTQIENLSLFVHRFTTYDKSTGKKKYTTNITESLNQLIDLPWKKWLSDINWQQAGGSVRISKSQVVVTDDLKILDECSLTDINISLSRINESVKSTITLKSNTHKNTVGNIIVNLNATLNKEGMFNKNSKLGFLNKIIVKSNLEDIDLAQYLEYFGINKLKFNEFTLTLKDPISLWANVNSTSMTDVLLKAKLSSDSIGNFAINKDSIGITPKLKLDVFGKVDFSNTWSEISPLILKLKLYNPTGEILSATSQINGNFGSEFIATIDALSDLSIFSSSTLGKKLGFNVYGKVKHSLAMNWKRNGIWKANYIVNGEGVSTTINDKKVALPLQGEITSIVTKSNILTPLKGSVDFSFNMPFLEFSSTKPLNIDFTNKDRLLTTSIKYRADLEKIYDNFNGIFNSFNVPKISEVIVGTLDADTVGNIFCSFTASSKLKKFKNSPISVKLEFLSKPNKNYDINFKASNSKDLQLAVNGTLEQMQQLWKIKFSQSGIYNTAIFDNFKARFHSVLGEVKLPFTFDGNLREAVNANINYQSMDNYTIAASVKAELKDLKLNFAHYNLAKNLINIESAMVLKRQSSNTIISFNHFNFKTPSSFINFSSGDYDLMTIDNSDWRKTLKSLPPIDGKLSISKDEMKDIGELANNDITLLYFNNATLSGAFQTNGGAKSLVKDFNYTSDLISVDSHKDFYIDPILMTNKIVAHKWFEIQQSLSDISATVKANLYNWRSFLPKVAVDVTAPFEFDAEYIQKGDRLKVHKFVTSESNRNELLIPSISFTGSVVDFFKNIKNFNLKDFTVSVDHNLHISKANISISKIKELDMAGAGSNLRALQGKFISVKDFNINHSLNSNTVTMAGSIAAKASYMSKSSVWPLLSINGLISNYKNPLVFQFEPEVILVKGSLDFTDSDISFNALSPYTYYKPIHEPLKLDFIASQDVNNVSKVRQASLVGGPLSVLISKFSLKPIRDRFTLGVDSIKLDGPFTVKVNNLLLDSAGDRFTADIDLAPLDLSTLQNNIKRQFTFNLAGMVNGAKIHIDDSYWKYFAPVNTSVKVTKTPNNNMSIGATNVTLSPKASTDSTNSLSFAFSGGTADVSADFVSLHNFTIDNPHGFSKQKAVEAKLVNIKPDFKTLFSDQIIIDRIDVDELNAYYEVAFTTNNFDALKNNLQLIFSEDTRDSDSTTRKTLIRDLYVTNGIVRLSSTLLLGMASIPVPLNLHLQNIGGESPGQTLVTGIGSIFTSIGKIGVKLVGSVTGVVGGVGKVGKSIITAPLKLLKNIGNDVEDEDIKDNKTR